MFVVERVRASHGDEAVSLYTGRALAQTAAPAAPGHRVRDRRTPLLLEGQLLLVLDERVRLAHWTLLLLLRIEVHGRHRLVQAVHVLRAGLATLEAVALGEGVAVEGLHDLLSSPAELWLRKELLLAGKIEVGGHRVHHYSYSHFKFLD